MVESSASSSTELLHVLQKLKVRDIKMSPNNSKASRSVVEVTADMTPVEAAQVLWKNKILGAPVWDTTHERYIGFFDMRDLLSTVVASYKEQEEEEHLAEDGHCIPWAPTKWFEFLNSGKGAFGKQTATTTAVVFTVPYLAARNPCVSSLTVDSTLQSVCQVYAKHRCHRIPIVDLATGHYVRIISQSALVKFFVENLLADDSSNTISPALKSKFETPLRECGTYLVYKKKVITAPDTATARGVFELMDLHGLSGIAIVDESDGALLGNTSATDIRLAVDDGRGEDESEYGREKDGVVNLNMDILSYLTHVRQATSSRIATKYPSTHVRESATVGHIMRLLAKTGYHRVFVVDEMKRPIGVVSVTDIVKFINHCMIVQQ